MRPDDIRRMLERRPFRPFRLYILESTTYEIRHPELALVTQSTVNIHFPVAQAPVPLGENYVSIALLHISKLEPLLPLPATNGPDGKAAPA